MTLTDNACPAPPAEAARLAAVRRYDVLDTPPDGAFDRVASLAARLLDTPVGLVSIVDEDRVWLKATYGLTGVSEVGRDPGLCSSVIAGEDDTYVVEDALADERTRSHPLVVGDLGLRFYAAAPILTRDGHRLGTVNVIDTRPRQVTADDTAVLVDLAAIVMDELELRLSAMRVVEAERRLREQAEREAARVERAARLLRDAMTKRRPVLPTAAERVCELRPAGAGACIGEVAIKLVDLTGASGWGCLDHAAEALSITPGAFVASTDAPTLANLRAG